MDDRLYCDVLLAALEELKFAIAFEVEEEQEDRDDDAGDKPYEVGVDLNRS